jgi:hypothetical protein
MSLTKQEVLDVIVNNDEMLTGNAIAQVLSYAKKTKKLGEILEALVEVGAIEENNDDRYTRYALLDENVLANHEKYSVSEFDPNSVEIPVDCRGYDIAETSKGFRVVFPNASVHNITRTQRILVINGEKHILIKSPENILGAIQSYCALTQIENCVLRDLSVGRIVDPENVNCNPVLIFVAVERHNKAGQ